MSVKPPAPDRFKAVAEWVTKAQGVMTLGQWVVTVSPDNAAEDAWADIEPHHQALTATLRLGREFFTLSPERQRLVLAHELTHLGLCRVDHMVDTLEDTNGAVWWSAWNPNFENELERAVEWVAVMVAQLLPMPRFSK